MTLTPADLAEIDARDLALYGVSVRRLVQDDNSASGMSIKYVPYAEYIDLSDPVLKERIRVLEADNTALSAALKEAWAEDQKKLDAIIDLQYRLGEALGEIERLKRTTIPIAGGSRNGSSQFCGLSRSHGDP